MKTSILSTQELAEHLEDPLWAIIDCRFDLANPAWGHDSYRKGHIPGAVFADLNKDLSAPVTPKTGRHPLPTIEEISRKLSGWGVGDTTQVVVYDTVGGAFAARLWFQLRFLGHLAVAVLDGGFQKWQRENRPTRQGDEQRAPAFFTPRPDSSLILSAEDVERIRLDPGYRLVDARAAVRFRGESEPIDPVAGHIPGAVNRFHGENLDPEGTFLPPEVLRNQWQQLIEGTSPERVVVYCGSGVTSCHHILAMEIAGLPGAKLYAGSWSEWIRDEKRPKSKQ